MRPRIVHSAIIFNAERVNDILTCGDREIWKQGI